MSDAVKIPTAEADRNLPKRFYKIVSVERIAGGYVVTLDGRTLKTPARANLALPNAALAKLVAQEWADQGEFIRPETMIITGFCNAAIDRVATHRDALESEVCGYADTDTLSYRDADDSPLTQRQLEMWDPILEALEDAHEVQWLRTSGIMPGAQMAPVMALAQKDVAALDKFALTAFSQIVALLGSYALALALRDGHIEADHCWNAAFLESDWQAEQWGEDAQAKALMADRRTRFDAAWSMLQTVMSS